METSYTYARDHLAELWDKAISDCEPVIVKRRGHSDLALIAADELRSMTETLHLLRSPANAERLLRAADRVRERHPHLQSTAEPGPEPRLDPSGA
jgi:antitoxin YefM